MEPSHTSAHPHGELVIALYLPQFHPIPENDEFWGKGFTEWTNVAKAKPLFPGHRQPNVPADLGFYDLRLPEARQAQADLARRYGIGGFCYYHYWFAGRRVLERPFREVLASGEPRFPFCLCWANESWSGIWHGAPQRVLIEQAYPGEADHERHFHEVLPAFLDKRYVRIGGKPVFGVFKPGQLPDARRFTAQWQELAIRNGLEGIHFVGFAWNWQWDHAASGFDAFLPQHSLQAVPAPMKADPKLPTVYAYEEAGPRIVPSAENGRLFYPCVMPNWDNTPRSGGNGLVFQGSTPEGFKRQFSRAVALVRQRPDAHRVIFVKAWNEWAEGNYLEPDLRFGHGYLRALAEVLASP